MTERKRKSHVKNKVDYDEKEIDIRQTEMEQKLSEIIKRYSLTQKKPKMSISRDE